jgi:hypothetical protein
LKDFDMQIKYEQHPVSPERKAELRKQGYKIIDAQFDPSPAPAVAEEPAKRPYVRRDK